MTIAELKKELETYPEDNFVHIRVWVTLGENTEHVDMIVSKTQQGVDGSILITGDMKFTLKQNWQS